MNNNITYAWRELSRRKGRSITTIIGYIIAVSAAIILVTLLTHSTSSQDVVLSSIGTHFIAFSPFGAQSNPKCCIVPEPVDEYEGFVAGNAQTNIYVAGVALAARRISSVKEASAALWFRFKAPDDKHLFTVAGLDLRYAIAVKTNCASFNDIVEGAFLDTNSSGNVLLEERYALSRGYHVGDQVIIAQKDFTIIGIVNSGIRPVKADMYMLYDDARKVINKRVTKPVWKEFNILMVESKNPHVHAEAMQAVKDMIGANTAISTYQCSIPAGKVMGLNEKALWLLVIVIFFGLVLFTIRNQFGSVIERRREIGILRAIGWKSHHIVTLIFTESLIQAGIGITGAAVLCMLLVAFFPVESLLTGTQTSSVQLSWETVATISGYALITGIVAGIVPVITVVYKKPASLMRKL